MRKWQGDRAFAGARMRRSRRGRLPVSHAQSLGEALTALLESMGGTRERAGLQRLWDNWEATLGAELAAVARPLGHKAPRKPGAAPGPGGATLLLSAEDAMLLQELRMRSTEILERVNGFLGQAYFAEVKVSLALGRSAPVRSRETEETREAVEAGAAPLAEGRYLEVMDKDSPVARCYARFVEQKKLLEKETAKPGREREKNDKLPGVSKS